MTEKRYYKRMWEEEYYIFDSQNISEKDFDEKLEYEDYNAFVNSMMGDEVIDRLNELNEENQKLKEDAKQVLFVLACCNKDFGLSVNEAKAIKRLNENVGGCYNIEGLE